MMKSMNELVYWAAFAHVSGIRNLRKNEIIKKLVENELNIGLIFNNPNSEELGKLGISKEESYKFSETQKELPNYSFIIENLLNQGYEIIPITSTLYPANIKKNLKMKYSPAVVYIKGNIKLLEEKSIAILGSRKATQIALDFADNIAKSASENLKVVVSGFAQGVDRQALDSALSYSGQSIIVLPQGIATFSSGFKKYYKQIVKGDVLVLSTFFPNAPWSVQLAMARNPIIYGLADEIFVAESSDKGGTWSGVIDGLRKGRMIYVRNPEPGENNANSVLIEKGGTAVDMFGNIVELSKLTGKDENRESGRLSDKNSPGMQQSLFG